MVVDNPKAVNNQDYFDKSNRFYLRLKDNFFQNVNPGSKMTIDSEEKNEEVSIDDDEKWFKHFSTVLSNEEGQEKYRYEVNGRYEYKHANKYDSKNVVGAIAQKIAKDVKESIKDNTLEYIGIKESRKKGKIKPALRIMLGDPTKSINVVDVLNSDICRKYGVDGITLLLPSKSKCETRGIRCRVDENGTRIYEVANGSYYMTLNWYAEGEECEMKIIISDNGAVEFIESNGVTWEQLAANKEVKVGRQYEAKPLYEALSYLKREGSEVIKGFYPSTSVESIQITTGVNKQAALSKL
ncbi:hypothetical protein [Wolbachia endosymbiont of Chrysomya megacephala]|uniref:hypothetical protein n=2 Tax=unclassified Wolbachia TaxID=2640676 RepID=UPI0011ECDBED|nr:hypothetical protein [Wolbachia endosymbiont of Chrysomya megacephala]QEK89859.1 hypothetical protein CAI20_04090 [Wolbachia endosymbiont of Chrysomya megacephala]